MVTLHGNRRGAGTTGCLVTLLLFGAAVYYGLGIGGVYFKYFRLKDAMQGQANMAPSITDDVIRRRLAEESQAILQPARPLRFRISRGGRPPRIRIETEYTDSVKLPLLERTFQMRPSAEAPL